jgi:hypothetical protein
MFNPRLSASICGSLLLFPICLYLRYLRRSVCSPSASSVPLCFKGFVPDHRITRSRAITRFLTILAIFLLGEFFHRVRQGLSTRKTAQRTCPITRRIVNYPNYLFLPGAPSIHTTPWVPHPFALFAKGWVKNIPSSHLWLLSRKRVHARTSVRARL